MGVIYDYTYTIYKKILTSQEQDSFDYFNERLISAEERNDFPLCALSHYALSYLFYNLSMYYDSLKSLQNAYACFRKSGPSWMQKPDLQSFAQLELCFIYCRLKKLESITPLPSYVSKEYSENLELEHHRLMLLARISSCHGAMDDCLRYSQKMLDISTHALPFRDFSEYEILLKDFISHSEFSLAKELLDKLECFASQTVQPDLLLRYWRVALEYWQATGNHEKWLLYFDKYHQLSMQREERVLKSLQNDIRNKDLIFHQVDLKLKMMGRVEQLKERAELDALTRLPNRYKISDYALSSFKLAQERHQYFGLMLIDIDNFKQYNDRFGHLTGDQCLTMVADKLLALAGNNFVARYGGDEFLAIFENCELQEILDFAEDLNSALLDVSGISREQLPTGSLTISQGIVYAIPEEHHSWSDFLNAADQELYRGKAKGKNQICIITNI